MKIDAIRHPIRLSSPEVGTFVGMSYFQNAERLYLEPNKELKFAVDPWNVGIGFEVGGIDSRPHSSMEQVVYEDEEGLVALNRWLVKARIELENVQYQPSPF